MPASMRLAVRVGFGTFLVALAAGAIMIALGWMVSLTNWSEATRVRVAALACAVYALAAGAVVVDAFVAS